MPGEFLEVTVRVRVSNEGDNFKDNWNDDELFVENDKWEGTMTLGDVQGL